MEVNHLMVWLAAIASMVVGFIWYGPLFGKKWSEIVGVTNMTPEMMKEMQKKAGPLYLLQFLLSVLQVYVLACFMSALPTWPALHVALLVWLGFVIPIVAGSAMWNNDSKRISWMRFGIQATYQLVLFVIYALILG